MRHAQLLRWRAQRRGDDPLVIDMARATRAGHVVQPGKALGLIPGTPPDHRWARDPTRAAISVFASPAAASSTIRARCADPAVALEDRVQDASTSRSPSRRTNAGAARAGIAHDPAPSSVNQLTTHTTRAAGIDASMGRRGSRDRASTTRDTESSRPRTASAVRSRSPGGGASARGRAGSRLSPGRRLPC